MFIEQFFGGLFNSFVERRIRIDLIAVLHTYADKIPTILECQIHDWGGRDGVKAFIAKNQFSILMRSRVKCFQSNRPTENQTLQPDLHTF